MWALWRGRWAQLYRGYYYWYIDLQLIYRKCIQCWSLLETSKYWNIFLILQVTQSELAHTNSCCFRKLEVICDIWDILLIIKCCLLFYYFLLFRDTSCTPKNLLNIKITIPFLINRGKIILKDSMYIYITKWQTHRQDDEITFIHHNKCPHSHNWNCWWSFTHTHGH